MKGNPEIITALNTRLAEEYAAFIQYFAHASMCANQGYKKLTEYFTERANQEKEHAIELIDRILYLEGIPLFAEIAPVNVGKDILEMFPIGKDTELAAIAGYAESIMLAMKLNDVGTMCLLQHILVEEEKHLGEIESKIAQITQSGIEAFLVAQIG